MPLRSGRVGMVSLVWWGGISLTDTNTCSAQCSGRCLRRVGLGLHSQPPFRYQLNPNFNRETQPARSADGANLDQPPTAGGPASAGLTASPHTTAGGWPTPQPRLPHSGHAQAGRQLPAALRDRPLSTFIASLFSSKGADEQQAGKRP